MPIFETAKYQVIKKITKRIELRTYDAFNLATTTEHLDNRYSNGFSNVFGYISGQNESSKKISMTTPVVSTIEDNSLTTGFVIPSKLKNNTPKPTSENVQITEIESGYFLTIRFSGSWTKENFDKYDLELKKFIDQSDYKIISSRYILRYQPPITPSFLRRNEIMYRVEAL